MIKRSGVKKTRTVQTRIKLTSKSIFTYFSSDWKILASKITYLLAALKNNCNKKNMHSRQNKNIKKIIMS